MTTDKQPSARNGGGNDATLSQREVVDALKGLYGLLQLRNSSDPSWEKNHRAVEARRIMALAEAHGVAPDGFDDWWAKFPLPEFSEPDLFHIAESAWNAALRSELERALALPVSETEDSRDAARHRWWRAQANDISCGGDEIEEMAFDCQIDIDTIARSTPAELMDAVADFNIAQEKNATAPQTVEPT